MVTTIAQLKSLVDNTPNYDVPVISYAEWLECLKDLLAKIENNEEFNYNGIGSLVLMVEVSDMDAEGKKKYDNYCNLLRKFFGLYDSFNTTPKECWDKVVNNPDIGVEPQQYKPLN